MLLETWSPRKIKNEVIQGTGDCKTLRGIIPVFVLPPPSPPVLLALILPCPCLPFCPDVPSVMDGITTGTRPESRGPDLVIGITCPSRIISILHRSNQGEELDSTTRNLRSAYKQKPDLEKALLLLFFFLSYGVPHLLYLGSSPLLSLFPPPLSNLSNPCLRLSGPWFMEELRLP